MNHPPGPIDDRLVEEPSAATDYERRGVIERQLIARLRGLGYQVTDHSVMIIGAVKIYTYALVQIPGRVGPSISFYITRTHVIACFLHAQGAQVLYNHTHFIPEDDDDDLILYVQTTLGLPTQAAPQTQEAAPQTRADERQGDEPSGATQDPHAPQTQARSGRSYHEKRSRLMDCLESVHARVCRLERMYC